MIVILRAIFCSGSALALGCLALTAFADDFKDASAAFKEKNFPRAVEILDARLKENPKSIRAYSLRGRAFLELRQFDKALADFNQVIEDGGDKGGGPLFQRGRAYLGMNPPQLDNALADFNKSIELDPKQDERYFFRGWVYGYQDKPDAAFADFHKAIELDPKRAEYYVARGDIQIDRSFTKRAEAIPAPYGGVILTRPGVVDRDKFLMGIADYTRAFELEPEGAGLSRRIVAYLGAGDIPQMVEDQRTMCKLHPEFSGEWMTLAWSLATSKFDSVRNGKEAVEAAEKAAELTKRQDFVVLDVLAAAYAEEGKFKKAVTTQEKAIELLAQVPPPKDPKQPKLDPQPLQTRLELYKQKKPYREGIEPPPTAAP